MNSIFKPSKYRLVFFALIPVLSMILISIYVFYRVGEKNIFLYAIIPSAISLLVSFKIYKSNSATVMLTNDGIIVIDCLNRTSEIYYSDINKVQYLEVSGRKYLKIYNDSGVDMAIVLNYLKNVDGLISELKNVIGEKFEVSSNLLTKISNWI